MFNVVYAAISVTYDDNRPTSLGLQAHVPIVPSLMPFALRPASQRDTIGYTCSGADSIEHGGTCPPLLQMIGHVCTVNRRTAENKLTKLY